MRGRYKRKDRKYEDSTDCGDRRSPLPGEPASGSESPNSPVSESTGFSLDDRRMSGSKCTSYDREKKYLGVRVKMPVKDMLRNIRIAKGWDPQDFQENCAKASKGEKKRVNTCAERRNNKRKHPTKSLEELAIIVEVLEEDLKTGNSCSPPRHDTSPSNQPMSPNYNPDIPWGPEPHSYRFSLKDDQGNLMTTAADYQSTDINSPHEAYNNNNNNNCNYLCPYPPSYNQGRGYSSDDYDDIIPSPQSQMAYSPSTSEYHQALSPTDSVYSNLLPTVYDTQDGDTGMEDGGGESQETWNWNASSTAFFWAQVQREESHLRDVSASVLLATDEHGRTALHRVVVLGKRAQTYTIAKRMKALNSLDVRDSGGMTPLHLAAKYNQHLIVADLINLGASVNARDNSGKTCLHLSAENGYIRVLEVLKFMMKDGVYVDVEASDNNGLSVLQCAVVTLSSTVHELESSASPSQTRFHTLRKEQMMETLECLLQMGSFLHTQGGYAENAFEVEHEIKTGQFMQGVVSTLPLQARWNT